MFGIIHMKGGETMKKVVLHTSVKKETRARLKYLADLSDMPMNEYIDKLVKEVFEKTKEV